MVTSRSTYRWPATNFEYYLSISYRRESIFSSVVCMRKNSYRSSFCLPLALTQKSARSESKRAVNKEKRGKHFVDINLHRSSEFQASFPCTSTFYYNSIPSNAGTFDANRSFMLFHYSLLYLHSRLIPDFSFILNLVRYSSFNSGSS